MTTKIICKTAACVGMRTVYHRDHTVTVWDIFAQSRVRLARVPDHILATLSDDDRKRIARHTVSL